MPNPKQDSLEKYAITFAYNICYITYNKYNTRLLFYKKNTKKIKISDIQLKNSYLFNNLD